MMRYNLCCSAVRIPDCISPTHPPVEGEDALDDLLEQLGVIVIVEWRVATQKDVLLSSKRLLS